MSIRLLKAMMSRPSSKGWFWQFGSKHTGRRQRHRERQMKFFSGPKFKKQSENSFWKFANKKRDGMGWN